MGFNYAYEKFSQARRCLMLPHPQGESASIATAFDLCSRGLMNLNNSDLSENARHDLDKLNALMDTTGLSDPNGVGLDRVKAETLNQEQRLQLSQCVDELANWFRLKCDYL